jgi:cyanophycinase
MDIPAPIVLVGGDEFRPECESMDRALLNLRVEGRPRVVILPTAAAGQRPELAASNGIRHFESLGARAEAAMVVDKTSANDRGVLQPLMSAGLIYLAGGNPSRLLQILRATDLWAAIRTSWAAGSVLAGSSAGAMVLGEWMFAPGDPPTWVKTVAAAPRIAVLPHFDRWSVERRDQAMSTKPLGITLLGIPGASGIVLGSEGGLVRVVGERSITIVTADGEESIVDPGVDFVLA